MTSPWLLLPAAGTALMVLLMAVLWAVHMRVRNAAVVDVGWAAGLGLLAGLYAALGSAPAGRRVLLVALVGLWAFRLAFHLWRDRVADGKPEEGRYVELRNRWSRHASRKFLGFFLAQGLLNVLLSLPFLLAAMGAGDFPTPLDLAAVSLWLLALAGEATADAQLKAFKAQPLSAGAVCRQGLWRYSRHPNYFCEWLIWCAYALLASGSGPPPLAALGWMSPLLILYLLLKVTGIPPTEAQALRGRGAAYRKYQAETSAFFPWFPKRPPAQRRFP